MAIIREIHTAQSAEQGDRWSKPVSMTTHKDKRLSIDAYAILSFALAQADTFCFSHLTFQYRFHIGRAKLEKALRELKSLGYLTISRNNGLKDWLWTFFEQPLEYTQNKTLNVNTNNIVQF